MPFFKFFSRFFILLKRQRIQSQLAKNGGNILNISHQNDFVVQNQSHITVLAKKKKQKQRDVEEKRKKNYTTNLTQNQFYF